jgi:hypothetical protein
MKSDYIIGALLRDYMARQSAGRRVTSPESPSAGSLPHVR